MTKRPEYVGSSLQYEVLRVSTMLLYALSGIAAPRMVRAITRNPCIVIRSLGMSNPPQSVPRLIDNSRCGWRAFGRRSGGARQGRSFAEDLDGPTRKRHPCGTSVKVQRHSAPRERGCRRRPEAGTRDGSDAGRGVVPDADRNVER